MGTERSSGVLTGVRLLLGGGAVAGQAERQLLERFLARRDELAFEAIVARHGPMVVGVCRSILADPTDADDAFQATFLVLVRKARSLRDGDQLGPWLHGVARRVALQARERADRRRRRESPSLDLIAGAPGRTGPTAEARELAALLHAEIDRLAVAERSALTLCDLEGLTHQEAADQLGWPLGTVKTRINRGRARLRARLTRRGLTLGSTGLAATLAGESVAGVVVARPLIVTTTRAALAVLAGRTRAAGLVSTSVLSLTQGALRTMIVTKIQVLALAVVATSAALAIPGVVAYQAQQDPAPAAPKPDGPARTGTKEAIPGPRDESNRKVERSAPIAANEGPARSPAPGGLAPDDFALLVVLETPFDFAQALPATSYPFGLFFTGFMNVIREDTRKSSGLPRGVECVFSDQALKIAQTSRVNLDRLATQDKATPLRVGLMTEARDLGLEYRVRNGKLFFDLVSGERPQPPLDPKKVRERDDDARNEAIRARLDEVVKFAFTEPVSFDTFLAYVKDTILKGTVPIYVAYGKEGDIGGGMPARARTEPAITIDVDGVPLRTSLRLVLRQVDFNYDVAGGVLIIGPLNSINSLSNSLQPASRPDGSGAGMGATGGFR